MENEEVKSYIIDFVVNTLSECEAFSKIYSKEFVEQQLNENLDKVITNVVTKRDIKGSYNPKVKAIILASDSVDSLPLTAQDIENDKTLKHTILHESIHAIFRKDKEECEKLGLKQGTGMDEMYRNGTELGLGLNEGLTEWICQKAGYGCTSYRTECNIVRMLALAIGEENVMQLVRGDIKGKVAKLLDLDIAECQYVLSLIDKIHDNEVIALSKKGDNTEELEILDKSISHFEATIFEKYFGKEIDNAINSDMISNESMRRLDEMYILIQGGETSASDIFTTRLPMKFKNEIYPKLFEKNRQAVLAEFRRKRAEENKNNLPMVKKTSWFEKIRQAIMKRFSKKTNLDEKIETKHTEPSSTFQSYISNMENYSNTRHEYTTDYSQTQKNNKHGSHEEIEL